MFSRTHKTTTEHRQPVDNTTEDKVIEAKIKEIKNILWWWESKYHTLKIISRRERGNNYQDQLTL